MADTDLSVTGADTSVQLSVDGALIQIQDKVTNFTEDEDVDEIVSKFLGRSGSSISQEFVGNNGTLEIEEASTAAGALQDTINAARVSRVPMVINIVRTVYFRDGTSLTYTYPDCKLKFGRKAARGEATKISITWKNGTPRIRS